MQARVYEYFLKQNDKQILVCENDKEAFLCVEVLNFLGYESYVLPDFRAVFGDDLRAFYDELVSISSVLSKYYKSENSKKIIISPIRTLLNKLPCKNHLKSIKISFADKLDLDELKDEILRLGYSVVDIVQMPAEVSFRADIIDIFSPDSKKAFRILLDDNEVESIREFDVNTQKSEPNELESVEISAFIASLSKQEFLDANEKIKDIDSSAIVSDLNSLGFWVIDGFKNYLEEFSCIFTSKFDKNEIFTDKNLDFLDTFEILPEAKKFKDLNIQVGREFFEFHKDTPIKVLARNDSIFNALNLQEFQNIQKINSPCVVNLTSKDEIIISLNKPEAKKRVKKSTIVIDELKVGDFVVHEDYGIGKFTGLELVRVLGSAREFVSIVYQNDDKLLLPVENLNLIDRYIATGGVVSLDKLGKASFAKIKEKVREKLFIIASKIISIAAQRELVKGIKIKKPDDYLRFLSSSGFNYTPDQEKSVEDIFNDLNSGKVMDRLLSGDVGFGKTEVAMNAIFACVKSEKVALFFVPTTLLSNQHYKSLKERFKEFEIPVYKLDRFTSAKEKSEVKKLLLDGKPLVCVGTHSLLSLKANNIGLIVIDEEHKFGVKQKEKLKEISSDSHLLSMSATPIPRSLNMALSGIKSYSTLMSAPSDRQDVRTMVKEWDEKIIKEAILRELRRGGQVFYVHNHIASIEIVKKSLLKIIPNLRILTLHSKIDAKTTEEEILKFSNNEYDLLLCTSIVESGIHMPNVNTILIDSANKFGIADLHQLRGRVGRANKQGYCYFLIEDKSELSSDAIKRLVALENNSFLGSGSVLAYHDLEIRGGGNLVGEAQSGHIEAIGYSLYLKMLEDEINKLMNKEIVYKKDIDLKISINAFLNEEFIKEDRLRLDLYRRLSKCESVQEIYEISSEMEDRFGKMDIYTKQFIDLMIIKILALSLDIKLISTYETNILITKQNDEKIRLKSRSKDDDDVLAEILSYLRKEKA